VTQGDRTSITRYSKKITGNVIAYQWHRIDFDPFMHLATLEGAEIMPGKHSDTRIKPLPLTNGHGCHMTVTPERALVSVGEWPLHTCQSPLFKWAPRGILHIWLQPYFYNHARCLRLEKLLYLELSRSPNGFLKYIWIQVAVSELKRPL
jgi:hypothetical protein